MVIKHDEPRMISQPFLLRINGEYLEIWEVKVIRYIKPNDRMAQLIPTGIDSLFRKQIASANLLMFLWEESIMLVMLDKKQENRGTNGL